MEAVSQALESEDVKSALATVDTELRFPTQAVADVPHAASASAEAQSLKRAASGSASPSMSTTG